MKYFTAVLDWSTTDFPIVLKLFSPWICLVILEQGFSSMLYEKISEYFVCFRVGNRARGKQFGLELCLAYNRRL